MKNLTFNGVDIFNPLMGKLEDTSQQFVLYYGEQYRTKIEKVLLEDTTYIFMPKLGTDCYKDNLELGMENFIFDTECKILKEFEQILNVKLFDSLGMPFSFEEVVSAEQKWINGDSLSAIEKQIIKSFCGSSLKEKSKTKSDIIYSIEKYKELYKTKFLPCIEKLEKEQANVLKFANEEIDVIEKVKDDYYNSLINLIDDYFYFLIAQFGNNISDSKKEELLPIYKELIIAGKLPEMVTKRQSEDYINLFNAFGINLGDDYMEYYKHSADFEDIIFRPALMRQIERLDEKLDDDLITKNTLLVNAIKIIDSLNIKYPQNRENLIQCLYEYMYFDNVAGFVVSYIEDGTNEYKHVCICGDYITIGTDTIIHEMNHLVEMNYLFETEQFFCEKTGFDVVPIGKFTADCGGEYVKYCDEKGNRQYMYLSEVLNEFLTVEIVKQLNDSGIELGLGEKFQSSYEDVFPILGKFIQDNKALLVNARMCSTMEGTYKIIPKFDLVTLAQIATKVFTDKRFMKEVSNEIQSKTNIKLWDYDEVQNLLKTKDSVEWSEDVKKFFHYLEIINGISQKTKKTKETIASQ